MILGAGVVAPYAIDVRDWLPDEQFSTYPIGSRPKQALFPADPPPLPLFEVGRRYLFKRSSSRYPEQYWSEVIAYHVGCAMGVSVPPAFPAFDSETGEPGALIEWFYRDEDTLFSHAGDLLQRFYPAYDRDRGVDHCFPLLIDLCRAVQLNGLIDATWRDTLARYFLFDALIGNTDRHQDNWGFTLQPGAGRLEGKLAPAFDNGTSLGHELDPGLTVSWPEAKWGGYMNRGKHHIRDEKRGTRFKFVDTFPMLRHTLSVVTVDLQRDFDGFSLEGVSHAMHHMRTLEMPVPLTHQRQLMVEELLRRRRQALLRRATS